MKRVRSTLVSPLFRARRALRGALLLTLLGGLAACSAGAEDPLAGVPVETAGGAGSDWVGALEDCEEGAQRACTRHLAQQGDVSSCVTGVETCTKGRWSDCQVAGTSGSRATAPFGLQPLADPLSTPLKCEWNPCDVGCRVYNEAPATPLVPDISDEPVIDWEDGSGQIDLVLGGFPGGLADKGYHEPCRYGTDCQFNMKCVHPSTGCDSSIPEETCTATCSHSKCVRGQGLALKCDPCVDLICAKQPSCCNTAGNGIPGTAEGAFASSEEELATLGSSAQDPAPPDGAEDPVDALLKAGTCPVPEYTAICKYSVYATASLETKQRSSTSGAVGSGSATGTTYIGADFVSPAVQVRNSVVNEGKIAGNVVYGGTFANQNFGTVGGVACQQTTQPLPLATQDFTVSSTWKSYEDAPPNAGQCKNHTLAPGDYYNVKVDRGWTLVLNGQGTYTFNTLTFVDGGTGGCAAHSNLQYNVGVGQKINVRVLGDIKLGNFLSTTFQDGSSSPGRVDFYSNGNVIVGTDLTFFGTIVAPRGKITYYSRSGVKGALYAANISLEPESYIDSSEINSACPGCTAANCNDSNPCTNDTCLAGLCVRSDVVCTSSDKCRSPRCDPAAGGCTTDPVVCDDGSACTADSCNAVTGCTKTAIDCDKGDICKVYTCNAGTGCAEAPKNCSDGKACTDDSCAPVVGCVHKVNCDDGDACTTEGCDAAGACASAPVDCNDNNACTLDSCNTTTGCVRTPVNCNDNNACTDDSCDPAGGCQHPQRSCDDGNPCTVDGCDPAGGCTHSPVNCDDGNACTTDQCTATGACAHTPLSCDDGEPCTSNSCNPASGCVYSWDVVCGSDGDACTQDSCVPGAGCVYPTVACPADATTCTDALCVGGACTQVPNGSCQCIADADCNDGSVCTLDTCVANTCVFSVAVACDDGNPCTVDHCDPLSGACSAIAGCDDANACTVDSCDPSTGCVHTALNCTDDDACTVNACEPGTGCTVTPRSCDDVKSCTSDSCDPLSGCANIAASCDDSNACTVELCSEPGGCGYAAVDCDDGNACTEDTCDATTGCAHSPKDCDDNSVCTDDSCDPAIGCLNVAISCADGDECTTDACDPLTGCTHGSVVCNDGNACTTDGCNPATGCVTGMASCDDGNACTTDACNAGTGCTTTPVVCNDGNACTADTCDPAGGCLYNAINCDDGDACTTDTCDAATGCKHATVTCADANVCTTDTCDPAVGCKFTNNTVACETDNNSCTTDVCKDGVCTHKQNGTCGWNQTCVDMVKSVCGAFCDTPTSAGTVDESGLCEPWNPLEVDTSCNGIDLSLGVACNQEDGTAGVSVCNHGTQQAPAGISIAYWSANSSHFPYTDSDITKADFCQTQDVIDSGKCLFTVCNFGQNKTMQVNPPGATHKPECSGIANWSLYRRDGPTCDTPLCMDTGVSTFSSTSCKFDVPDTILTGAETAKLSYVANGSIQALTMVSDASACTATGWYYENPVSPTVGVLCPATCTAVHSTMYPGMNITMECRNKAIPTTKTYDYHAFCELPDQRGQWGFLSWDTALPAGTSVVFRARTAQTIAELATATPVTVGTAATTPVNNEVCALGSTLASCPVSLYDALGADPSTAPYMRIDVILQPDAAGLYSPVVNDWEVTYSCADEF